DPRCGDRCPPPRDSAPADPPPGRPLADAPAHRSPPRLGVFCPPLQSRDGGAHLGASQSHTLLTGPPHPLSVAPVAAGAAARVALYAAPPRSPLWGDDHWAVDRHSGLCVSPRADSVLPDCRRGHGAYVYSGPRARPGRPAVSGTPG